MSEVKRGRPRKYLTGAERTAAHRARNADKKPPTQAEIVEAVTRLDTEIGIAAMEENSLAFGLRGENALKTLDRISVYIKVRGANKANLRGETRQKKSIE